MADNKSKRGGRDRSRAAGGQGYELGYFARKHGLSRDQARALITKVGNDREKLNAAAERLSGVSGYDRVSAAKAARAVEQYLKGHRGGRR
ncbi:MAG TPA: DUF3606 domain-containing protein [Sphingomicrobium sp.]